MLLRSRILLLLAAAVPAVAAAVAVPAWLLLRERDAVIGELTVVRQDAIVEREIQRAAQPLMDTAGRIAADASVAQALATQDMAAARARIATLDAGAARVEVIARGGRVLLAEPDDRRMEAMIDTAAVLREYRPGTGGSGIEPMADGHGLRLVAFARGPGTDVAAAAMDLAPVVTAIGAALGGRALVSDLAGRPLWPPEAAAWEGIGLAEPAAMPAGFRDGGRWMQVVPSLLSGSNGVPVARLFVVQDASATARRHGLVVLVAALVLVGAILLGGILLYRMLRTALEPLTELAAVLHAIAGGDRLASAAVDGRAEEIGRIARALEVLRSSGIMLDRMETRDRLARRRHLGLIGGELARLAAVFEPSERAAVEAVLRRLEDGEGAAGAGLAEAFQGMVDSVLSRQARLAALLAERTRDLAVVREALDQRVLLDRMVQELEVARRLQLDSLPSVFPASPAFAIHAAMWPAKEVGGDFYDVVTLPDGGVALMVGDASGKGVAAAIFVAMARSLLRAAITRGASPAQALAQANAALAADNPTMMFATAFVAILHPATGRLRYANAGHNPPRLIAASAGHRALGGADGIALGVVEDFVFEDREAMLAAGDRLLLFTDGVTEADRDDGSLFGDERLTEALVEAADGAPDALVAEIAAAVACFAAGCPQADDITLLCLAYAGVAAAQAAE
jgi:sigma-B regulation protein RsbU (phosphoserine phosphatase)